MRFTSPTMPIERESSLCATVQPNNSHLPWVEKYRPTQLNDIVHHKDIIHLLRVFMKDKEIPHIFFYGPPGTGKTSTILSVANEIYGKYMNTMVLHLNASDERGIEVVRKQIIQFASTTSIFTNSASLTKMVILDEADSMSMPAQIALRDIMMTYDTLFCFIGNYQFAFQSQLQSRVIKLLFTPIPKSMALDLGTSILQKEGQHCSLQVLENVYKSSAGDMRQFINLLQVLVMRGLLGNTSSDPESKNGSKNGIDTILCRWDTQKAVSFVDTFLFQQTVRDCNAYLQECIIHTQETTLLSWLKVLFKELYDRSLQVAQANEHINESFVEAVLMFCTEMATIECRLLHTLHTELQLYAMVSVVHRFASLLSSAKQQ